MKKSYSSNPALKKRIMSDIYEKKMFDYLIEKSKVSTKEKSIRKEMGIA